MKKKICSILLSSSFIVISSIPTFGATTIIGSDRFDSIENVDVEVTSYVNYNNVTKTSVDINYLEVTISNNGNRPITDVLFVVDAGNNVHDFDEVPKYIPTNTNTYAIKYFNKEYKKTSSENVYTLSQVTPDQTIYMGHRGIWLYNMTGTPDDSEVVEWIILRGK